MTRDIQKWLEEFRQSWRSKDIDSVMSLFTDDVKYHETPFEKLESKEKIREEWESVKDQEDVHLKSELFSKDREKFTVRWRLSYKIQGQKKELKGVYLIKLNENNKCFEFWQYCQSE